MNPIYIFTVGDMPASLWRDAAKLLTPACRVSATHTADDVAAAIRSGAMQLWTAHPADGAPPTLAAVTEVVEFPQLKQTTVCFAGGRALDTAGRLTPEAACLLAAIERFAIAHDCKRLAGGGRIGWMRVLRAAGWRGALEIHKDIETGDPK